MIQPSLQYLRCVLLFALLSLIICNARCQVSSNVRLVPDISLGYTFGRGLNAGLGLGISVLEYKINAVTSYTGLDISYSIFSHKRELYKNGFYRTLSLNLLNVINEQAITKIGFARTKLKWGLNNVNSNYSNGWGINLDIAVKPYPFSPQLGFRYFAVNSACLGLGQANPKFLYIGYQYPFLVYDSGM